MQRQRQYRTSWLSHAHRSGPQLCVWAVRLQTRKRLFVFPGICKHPQQKQVPLEWAEKLTPSGQLDSHSSSAFDVPRTALVMDTPYTLIPFNWSLDVTGCWDLVGSVFASKDDTLIIRRSLGFCVAIILGHLWRFATPKAPPTPPHPHSALTPPLATLGKKPPLPPCPWKEGQAFGSGHSLCCSSRPCLASTWRLLMGDSWDKPIVSAAVWSWVGLHNKSRLFLISK